MLRLIDTLSSGRLNLPPAPKSVPDAVMASARQNYRSMIASSVRRTTLIVADNVHQYLNETQHNEGVDLYTLPCAAPPFPNLWVEYMQGNGAISGIMAHSWEGSFSVVDKEPDDDVGANGFRRVFPEMTDRAKQFARGVWHPTVNDELWLSEHLPDQTAWDAVRWIWVLEGFVGRNNRAQGPFWTVRIALNGSGRMVDVGYEYHYPEVDPDHALGPVQVFMQTMNFMQCANIRTVYVDPPEALSRKHLRKGHIDRPLARYGVLQLDPLGPEQRNRGRRGDGSGVAWHRVRGEFHHYGDCCPQEHPPKGKLFGKLTGRYWVPAHERGSRDHGEVRSEFVVKAVPK